MTTTELELLRDFVSREMQQVRVDIRDLRKETATEHRQLREGLRTIALRVNDLEDDDIADDARDEGRREFKASVIRAVAFVNGLAIVVIAAVGLLLQHT